MEVAYACLEHPHLGPDHLEKSFTAQKATQHLIPGVKYNTISSHRPVFSGLIWRLKPCGMFKRTLKTCCLPSRRAGERGSDEHKDSGHQSLRLVVKIQQNTNNKNKNKSKLFKGRSNCILCYTGCRKEGFGCIFVACYRDGVLLVAVEGGKNNSYPRVITLLLTIILLSCAIWRCTFVSAVAWAAFVKLKHLDNMWRRL